MIGVLLERSSLVDFLMDLLRSSFSSIDSCQLMLFPLAVGVDLLITSVDLLTSIPILDRAGKPMHLDEQNPSPLYHSSWSFDVARQLTITGRQVNSRLPVGKWIGSSFFFFFGVKLDLVFSPDMDYLQDMVYHMYRLLHEPSITWWIAIHRCTYGVHHIACIHICM